MSTVIYRLKTIRHFNFWLSLSLRDSLSETLSWTLKSGLRPKFNLTLDLDFQKVKWLKLSFPYKFDRLKSAIFPPRRVAFSTWRGRKDGWNDIYSTDIVV